MPVECLICSSASSAIASSAVEEKLAYKNATLEIFKRLSIPIDNFDTLENNNLLKFCAKCFKIIVQVRSYLDQIDTYKLLMQRQIETVANFVRDVSKKGRSAPVKRGVTWDNFRKHVIQSFEQGLFPNPRVEITIDPELNERASKLPKMQNTRSRKRKSAAAPKRVVKTKRIAIGKNTTTSAETEMINSPQNTRSTAPLWRIRATTVKSKAKGNTTSRKNDAAKHRRNNAEESKDEINESKFIPSRKRPGIVNKSSNSKIKRSKTDISEDSLFEVANISTRRKNKGEKIKRDLELVNVNANEANGNQSPATASGDEENKDPGDVPDCNGTPMGKIKVEVHAPSSQGLSNTELKDISTSRKDKEAAGLNKNFDGDNDDNEDNSSEDDCDGELIPPDEIKANYPFEYPESLFSENENEDKDAEDRLQKWVDACEAPNCPTALYKLLQDPEPTSQVPFHLKMNQEEVQVL